MGIRKRKVKADFIEDYLGTEVLRGTYESRKHVAKLIEQERAWVNDQKTKQENELRKAALMKIAQRQDVQERYAQTFNKCMIVLQYTMMPDAYEFFMNMYNNEPETFMAIFKMIVPLNEFYKVDDYLARLMKTGKPPKNRIQLVTIIKIYRKIRGIKGKVEVVRDGVREPIFGRKIA